MENNKKRNIAIIIPTLRDGGAERVASNLSLYLSEKKYNKYIILYDAEEIEYPYKGILLDLNTKAINNPLGKIFNFIKRVYKVKKIKKRYKIQISISFLETANVVNIFTKGEDKVIPSIRNFKSKISKSFYGKIYNYLITIFYNRVNILVAVSKGVKEDLIKNYGIDKNKIKVIYNLYDLEKIQELSKEKIEDEYKEIFNSPVIINVGRLTRQKGQWHLIRAFKRVKEEITNIRLVILGRGELENYLKQLVSEMGLEKDVYFLGFQRNPFKFVLKSTIYVFSSLYEGFPNALVEAMACGIPVISSDCKSGPREILAPETNLKIEIKTVEYTKYGVLIPVCDNKYYSARFPLTNEEMLLAKSIVDLYSSQELLENYTHIAKERTMDFDKDKIIVQYENILR